MRYQEESPVYIKTLEEENRNLRNTLLELKQYTDDIKIVKVLYRDIYHFSNEIIIENKDLEINDLVLNKDGLIGIVKEINKNRAYVELINKDYHVSVKINDTYGDYYNGTVNLVDKFSNIKIDNGKIISESNDTTTLVGYTFTGLGQDLNADFLPSNFIVEADTTNFELGTVYSFATNELFAELDTSKLTSVDGIINSINDLSNGLDQIIAGSNDLTNGIDTLAAGISKLQLGANNLEYGANNLATGIAKLSNGLNSVVAFDNEILAKAYGVVDQVTATTEDLITKYNLDPALVAELTAPIVEYYNKINTAVTTYTGNIETLANGASELSVGANNLAAGTTELKNGINSLSAGAAQLSAGSHTLNQGLNTFKTSGIDKLVNFANQDAANFVYNFRQTVSAAKSYTTHTKFIFKTPSIK